MNTYRYISYGHCQRQRWWFRLHVLRYLDIDVAAFCWQRKLIACGVVCMGSGWRSMNGGLGRVAGDWFMHPKCLRLVWNTFSTYSLGLCADDTLLWSTTHTDIRLPNICFRQINKFIHFWWHCKRRTFVPLPSSKSVFPGLCASAVSKFHFLLSIEEWYAFSNKQQTEMHTCVFAADAVAKKRKWQWRCKSARIHCHYLFNGNCVSLLLNLKCNRTVLKFKKNCLFKVKMLWWN